MTYYEVQKDPYSKLKFGPNGPQESLCTTCHNRDCANPIETVETSEIGVNRKVRLWVVGQRVAVVSGCVGYAPD
jgi:hypothetical protein